MPIIRMTQKAKVRLCRITPISVTMAAGELHGAVSKRIVEMKTKLRRGSWKFPLQTLPLENDRRVSKENLHMNLARDL